MVNLDALIEDYGPTPPPTCGYCPTAPSLIWEDVLPSRYVGTRWAKCPGCGRLSTPLAFTGDQRVLDLITEVKELRDILGLTNQGQVICSCGGWVSTNRWDLLNMSSLDYWLGLHQGEDHTLTRLGKAAE